MTATTDHTREYVPLLGRFAFTRALVREVGSFTPGTSLMPLPSPAGPAGVAVCYEKSSILRTSALGSARATE